MVVSQGKIPRVFLDANILIRGITFPRMPYLVLEHAARKELTPIFSNLVVESARLYVEKLYPEQYPALELLLSLLEPEWANDPSLEQIESSPRLVRDPKDVPIALAAIHAKAEYLVSTDRDFTDNDESTTVLRKRITPMRPGDFLRQVMGWSSEDLSKIEKRRWEDLEKPFWEEYKKL